MPSSQKAGARAARAALCLCAALALFVSGCFGGGRNVVDEREALSDAEIAGVLQALNRELARQALLGRQRAISGFTREYAEELLELHVLANRELADVLAREGIEARPSPLAEELAVALERTWTELAEVELADFDRTFLGTEAELHAELALLLREHLRPSAERWQVEWLVRDLGDHYVRNARRARTTLNVSPLTRPPLTPLRRTRILGVW